MRTVKKIQLAKAIFTLVASIYRKSSQISVTVNSEYLTPSFVLRGYDGLNMLGPGSSTISCGLIEIGVALLEEVCHCGFEFEGPHPSSLEASLLDDFR